MVKIKGHQLLKWTIAWLLFAMVTMFLPDASLAAGWYLRGASGYD
jgi:hypothetical protein